MHRWHVGEVEVVRVEDDDFVLPSDRPVPAWAVPALATEAGEVGIAFSAVGIADGDRRIVVDPWLANDHPRSETTAAVEARLDRLLGALSDAGLPADQVDTIIDTHWDGDGWNTRPGGGPDDGWRPTFPAAHYFWPSFELDELAAGRTPSSPDGLAVLQAAGVLAAARPGRVSDHVHLVDAPGHGRGHLAVRIESDGDLCVVPGHLVLSPLQVADPTVASDEDPSTATATRRALLGELADRHGLLVTTLLGGPGGGRVSADGDGFRLDQR